MVNIAAKMTGDKLKTGAKKVNEDTDGALSWLALGGAVLLGGIIIKTLYNASKVGDVVGNVADAASSVLNSFTENIENPSDSTNTPLLITDVEAQNKAILLMQAMDGIGTDFQRIKETLTGITKADYVLIAKKFGTPRYLGTGQSPWPSPQRNLSYWIAAELDNKQIQIIRSLLPGLF